jgi:hypothetical protein
VRGEVGRTLHVGVLVVAAGTVIGYVVGHPWWGLAAGATLVGLLAFGLVALGLMFMVFSYIEDGRVNWWDR